MNPNVGMASMNPMGGPVGGAPMPMMNNGAINTQAAAAASAHPQQTSNNTSQEILNTYIYEYFLRYKMHDCARALLSSDSQVNVAKDDAGRRGGDKGNLINGVGDAMDTDTKEDIDSKLPDDLPPPKLPMPASDTSFLYEWFCLFWDIYNAQRVKNGNNTVNQYVQHTQTQNRLKQNHQQEMLRHMRNDPNMNSQYQAQMIRNMQNSPMAMGMKQGNLARAAMVNNQNPQMQMLQQQAKQNQMQRDPSMMDGNRERPSSPASGENAPSPSKRPRLDGAPFNANHLGNMMMNGRPGQGMPGQQMNLHGNVVAAQQMLANSGIIPGSLSPQQMQNFVNAPPAAQAKSIASYSQNLQQQQGNQMGGKPMPNAGYRQSHVSPMLPQGPDGNASNGFCNTGDAMSPEVGRGGSGSAQAAGSSNALQDYQSQLMLLESQNKKRLMMARQEQSDMSAMSRNGQPGGPNGPNRQTFPDASPQAMRTGTSPNPAEQMKRGTPQMNNSGIPSPVPEGGQPRDAPNQTMNFPQNHADPTMAPHFFKNMDPNMVAAAQTPMNGMRPPNSHPGQPFNGQMNPQMMARQQQQQQQGNQGNPQQWQQGPHGQMLPQGTPQNQQVQGPPQQRAMPPPSAPAAAAAAVNNANNRTTASPQQAAAAPPTPSQSNKAAPKTKKDTKSAKDKRAANQKKMNQNANNAGATPAGENSGEPEVPAPATPITPVNPGGFKPGQNGTAVTNGQPSTAAPATAVPAPNPTGAPAPASAPGHQAGYGDVPNGTLDGFGGLDLGGMDFVDPFNNGEPREFDFDSFLNDNDEATDAFDFCGPFPGMEGNEIGAEIEQ